MKDRNYVIAWIGTSLVVTFYFVFGAIVVELIDPFGSFTSTFNSNVGILVNLTGVFGAIIVSFIVGPRLHWLKKGTMLTTTLTLASFIFFIFASINGSKT